MAKWLFDDAFQTFVKETKAEVTRLRTKTLVDVSVVTLTERHEQNITTLETYSEDSIKDKLNELDHETLLAQRFESVAEALQALTEESTATSETTNVALTGKYDTPYNAVNLIDFDKTLFVFLCMCESAVGKSPDGTSIP